MAQQIPKRRHLSQQERSEVYDKLDGHCAYCGCKISIKQMQADHLVPLALGGADEVSNLLPSCRSCNHRKSTERLELFRHSVEHFEGVLARDNVTYRNAVRFGQVTPTPHPVVFYFEDHLRDTTKKVDSVEDWPEWKQRAALSNYKFGANDHIVDPNKKAQEA